MKRVFIIYLFISISAHLFSEPPFVEIYKTHDDGLYGRSEGRDIILSLKESVFKKSETLNVKDDENFLTAVVLDSKIEEKLSSLFKNKTTIQMGYIKLSKENNIYTVNDDNIFLSFSFSLEKPQSDLLEIIDKYYMNSPMYNKIVSDHYNANYVIRIHSAENILRSEAREITYDEAIVMATIIGDKDQWLWGIHDGSDYLKELLFD